MLGLYVRILAYALFSRLLVKSEPSKYGLFFNLL